MEGNKGLLFIPLTQQVHLSLVTLLGLVSQHPFGGGTLTDAELAGNG